MSSEMAFPQPDGSVEYVELDDAGMMVGRRVELSPAAQAAATAKQQRFDAIQQAVSTGPVFLGIDSPTVEQVTAQVKLLTHAGAALAALALESLPQ